MKKHEVIGYYIGVALAYILPLMCAAVILAGTFIAIDRDLVYGFLIGACGFALLLWLRRLFDDEEA